MHTWVKSAQTRVTKTIVSSAEPRTTQPIAEMERVAAMER